MAQHADDLAALLDALRIQEAHIGGISYGSEISMEFAIKYPQRTKSLIVIDGVSQIDPLLKAQSLPWLIAAERNDPELLLRTSVHMNFSEEWIATHQDYIEASVENFAKIDMPAFVELMKSFYNLDLTDRLSHISAPTLIIVGENDLIKGQKYSQIMADHIPQAEYVIVPGSGHALCLDKPDILNTLLIGFVQKNR